VTVARSGIGWTIAKMISLAASWLALAYFSRALTAPESMLGQYYVFESALALLVLLAGGGVTQAISKRVSEQVNVREHIGSGLTLIVSFSGVVTVVILLLWETIVGILGMGPLVLGIGIVAMWGTQLRTYIQAVLQGSSHVGRSGVVELIDVLAKTASQVALVASGAGVVGLIVGTTVAPFVALAVGIVFVRERLTKPNVKQIRSILRFGKYSYPMEFTSKFYDNIDTLVIFFFLGNAAVGNYNVAFRFSLIMSVFIGAIGTASRPEISIRAERGEYDQIRRMVGDGIIFSMLFAIPATVGMVLLSEQIIVTFYTGEFRAAALTAILAIAVKIPDSFRHVFTSTLWGLDRPDYALRSGVVLIVTNLLLDLALVPVFGIEGAAVASLIGISFAAAYSMWKAVVAIEFTRREFPTRELSELTIAAGSMGVIVWTGRQTVEWPAIIELTGLIALGVISYFLIVLVISRGVRKRTEGILSDITPDI
jgi:O-antigen/teichoic acid export membrane protein